MWNLSYTILHCGAHCSMLSRNGSHISTHAASIRFRCPGPQLASKIVVQRFLLPRVPEPQRLSRLQVAHHRQKFVLLAAVYLIHPHVPQTLSVGFHPNAPGIADRSPSPCSRPVPFSAPPAARRHSRKLAPPPPRTACCTGLYSAPGPPSRSATRSAGTSRGTVPPPPSSCIQSTPGRALPARRSLGSGRMERVSSTPSKSAPHPASSSSPTASDS